MILILSFGANVIMWNEILHEICVLVGGKVIMWKILLSCDSKCCPVRPAL